MAKQSIIKSEKVFTDLLTTHVSNSEAIDILLGVMKEQAEIATKILDNRKGK